MEEFFLQNDDLSTVTAVSLGLLYLVCLIISRRDGNTLFRRSIKMPKTIANTFANTVRAASRKWLITRFSNLVERAINKAQTKGEILEIVKTINNEMIQISAIYDAIDLDGGEDNGK